MLESFTPGELQAGAYIAKPAKQRDGTVYTKIARNKGTGIPASTWSRMQSGLITPGPRTLEKLARFKFRYQYNTLRSVGAPLKEAKRLSKLESLADASKRAMEYRRAAINVAAALSRVQNKYISPEWIMYHMMKGERDVEDWDKYVTAITPSL